MITYDTHEIFTHVLTPEGAQIAKDGSHEARVWAALPAKGQGTPVTPLQLKKAVGDETAKVGQGRAFKNGWISKEGDGLVKAVRITLLSCIGDEWKLKGKQTDTIQDQTKEDLQEVASTGTLKAGEKVLADLRKRKLVIQKWALLSL